MIVLKLQLRGEQNWPCGAMAKAGTSRSKATAHRCKRDMAWSEDAGRERRKAWMQASDEGNGLVVAAVDLFLDNKSGRLCPPLASRLGHGLGIADVVVRFQ
jgi:hypothetical protein